MTETTTSMMEKVTAKIPELFTLANTCFEAVVDNEVLLTFFTVTMIGLGLSVFRKLKRTAK